MEEKVEKKAKEVKVVKQAKKVKRVKEEDQFNLRTKLLILLPSLELEQGLLLVAFLGWILLLMIFLVVEVKIAEKVEKEEKREKEERLEKVEKKEDKLTLKAWTFSQIRANPAANIDTAAGWCPSATGSRD